MDCPFQLPGSQRPIVVDRFDPASPNLVHCQAWMNHCLSGGCRGDGCPFLHHRAVGECRFVRESRVIGQGFIRPKNYKPYFLNGQEE
ncbi:MAG: hypothetical protein WCX71_01215 [Candidatus Buchananbacteria bacterium]